MKEEKKEEKAGKLVREPQKMDSDNLDHIVKPKRLSVINITL